VPLADPSALVPGHLPGILALSEIRFISPSRYIGLRECPAREVLLGTIGHVLPKHPASELGNVTHALLEAAIKGELTESEIPTVWDSILREKEVAYGTYWFQKHLVPFAQHVPDFFVRRSKALTFVARTVSSAHGIRSAGTSGGSLSVEEPVRSQDGLIRGRIDLLQRTTSRVTIRDYKTGPLYEVVGDALEIKAPYVAQLRMYSALLRENGVELPIELELVSASGDITQIQNDEADGRRLLAEGRRLLSSTNTAIAVGHEATSQILGSLAQPGEHCFSCQVRPLCPSYRKELANGSAGRDILGELGEARAFPNNTQMARLSAPIGALVIRGLSTDPDRYAALSNARHGDAIAAFAVRSNGPQGHYTGTQWTTLYQMA
jgi:RecB family exonuclease